MKIIGTIGDVNYLEYDGGPVLRDEQGDYCLEYVEGPCDDVDVDDPEARWTVYRTDLSDPSDWCKWKDVAESCGQDVDQYTAPFGFALTGSESGAHFAGTEETIAAERDRNAMARADAIWDAASYYGWANFDSYPLVLTKDEVEARYAEEKREP